VERSPCFVGALQSRFPRASQGGEIGAAAFIHRQRFGGALEVQGKRLEIADHLAQEALMLRY
jgi:hypothetical protein